MYVSKEKNSIYRVSTICGFQLPLRFLEWIPADKEGYSTAGTMGLCSWTHTGLTRRMFCEWMSSPLVNESANYPGSLMLSTSYFRNLSYTWK